MVTSLRHRCGQLLVGGFSNASTSPSSPSPSSRFLEAVARGERGGAILFRRNLEGSPLSIAQQNALLSETAPKDVPLLLGIDQEGGPVARLRGAPYLHVPPMRAFGTKGSIEDVRKVAQAQATQLSALGFTMNFAPVLDVDTCPTNPIIGERSFSSDPQTVARWGVAWAQGLEDGGVLPCGKHFPGHGDTTKDSHVELPVVDAPRSRLEQVEWVPFRAAAEAGMASLMTAHVLYPDLDPTHPATLSPTIATTLLRKTLGFQGVLVSDDLEMGALRQGSSLGELAVQAVNAGCDLLLVCSNEDAQDEVVNHLVATCERDPAFRTRCEESHQRVLRMKQRKVSRPVLDANLLQLALTGAITPEVQTILNRLGQAP